MIVQDDFPGDVAVAFDDRVGAALLVRLLREERRVNAAEHNRRAGFASGAADGVSAEGIAAVNADADDVPRADA